jgi:AmmeMemoRadiSam system protein A
MSSEDCNTLLAYARRCIKAATERETVPPLQNPSQPLLSKKATFVTIRSEGVLRGCIGQIEATSPLWISTKEMSIAAACKDTRFPPLHTREPFQIEISILSKPEPISKENVIVGKHGLIVEASNKRGVLLPHVASEYGWDKNTFIEQTIRKADLPQNIITSSKFVLKAFQTYLVTEF